MFGNGWKELRKRWKEIKQQGNEGSKELKERGGGRKRRGSMRKGGHEPFLVTLTFSFVRIRLILPIY